MITCSVCGHLNDPSRLTCEKCGSDLSDSPDWIIYDDNEYFEDRTGFNEDEDEAYDDYDFFE
jgi:hypothetical protein